MSEETRENRQTRWAESRLFAVVLLGTLTAVLVFSASDLGGDLPDLEAFASGEKPAIEFPLNGKVKPGFIELPAIVGQLLAEKSNPFFTDYFQPAVPPTPPAPKFIKIQIMYQGWFESSHGERHAFLIMDGKKYQTPVGGSVSHGLRVKSMDSEKVVLEGKGGREWEAPFDQGTAVEIPQP